MGLCLVFCKFIYLELKILDFGPFYASNKNLALEVSLEHEDIVTLQICSTFLPKPYLKFDI